MGAVSNTMRWGGWRGGGGVGLVITTVRGVGLCGGCGEAVNRHDATLLTHGHHTM